MTRLRVLGLVAIFAPTALLATPATVTAASPVPDDTQAREVAASLRRSTTEMVQIAESQTAFNLEMTRLSVMYDPRSYEAWIDPHDNEIFNVRSKNPSLLQEMRRWAAASTSTVNVLMGEPLSAAPLDPAIVGQLQQAYPEMDGLYRDEIGLLHIFAKSPAHPPYRQLTSMAGGLSVSWGGVLAGNSGVVYGGNALGSCTVGFSARYGATVGFFTAAHCGSPQAYYAGATRGTYLGSGSTVSSRFDSNSDIAMLSVGGGNTTGPYYRGSDLGLVRVLGQTTATTGSTLCFRGYSSGYRCGQVLSIYYQPVYGGACPSACSNNFILLNTTTIPGDSGGPLVSGNYAAGIVKGYANGGGIFSKIAYTPGASSLQT